MSVNPNVFPLLLLVWYVSVMPSLYTLFSLYEISAEIFIPPNRSCIRRLRVKSEVRIFFGSTIWEFQLSLSLELVLDPDIWILWRIRLFPQSVWFSPQLVMAKILLVLGFTRSSDNSIYFATRFSATFTTPLQLHKYTFVIRIALIIKTTIDKSHSSSKAIEPQWASMSLHEPHILTEETLSVPCYYALLY